MQVISQDIRVGDILRIEEGLEFPADLVLLSSSNANGTCYLNTANLDGETAPKHRKSATPTLAMREASQFALMRGHVQCEPPNRRLDRFRGRLTIHASPGCVADGFQAGVTALGDKELLLRGAKLVNTAWVIGLVLYAGPHTKMMLNRNQTPFKFSRFERQLNRFVLILFIANILVCLFLALMALVFEVNHQVSVSVRAQALPCHLFGVVPECLCMCGVRCVGMVERASVAAVQQRPGLYHRLFDQLCVVFIYDSNESVCDDRIRESRSGAIHGVR